MSAKQFIMTFARTNNQTGKNEGMRTVVFRIIESVSIANVKGWLCVQSSGSYYICECGDTLSYTGFYINKSIGMMVGVVFGPNNYYIEQYKIYPLNFDELSGALAWCDSYGGGKIGIRNYLGKPWDWDGYVDLSPKIFREVLPVTGMPEILWPFLQSSESVDERELDRYVKRGGKLNYPLDPALVHKYLLFNDGHLVIRSQHGVTYDDGEGIITKIFDDGATYKLEV